MNKAFEKIFDRFEEITSFLSDCTKYGNKNSKQQGKSYSTMMLYEVADLVDDLKQIVQEVAEEYNGDMKHNLAEMYAKNMVDYGVDVTKEWQTATQQSSALEKAYIRGRQYEIDRFNELRKEYNDGWIPCSERLPDDDDICIVTVEYPNNETLVQYGWFDKKGVCWYVGMQEFRTSNVLAWKPLPQPYKESE